MNKDNEKNIEKKSAKKGKVGVVVSDKMDKTVVVKIDRLKMHSKYKKKYKVSKKYKPKPVKTKQLSDSFTLWV